MAGKFGDTRENTENLKDTDEFDLDLELDDLSSFLQEMGVELDDEADPGEENEEPVGDEITGSIFFDFGDGSADGSEDTLQSFLFGQDGADVKPGSLISKEERTAEEQEAEKQSRDPRSSWESTFGTESDIAPEGRFGTERESTFDTENDIAPEGRFGTGDSTTQKGGLDAGDAFGLGDATEDYGETNDAEDPFIEDVPGEKYAKGRGDLRVTEEAFDIDDVLGAEDLADQADSNVAEDTLDSGDTYNTEAPFDIEDLLDAEDQEDPNAAKNMFLLGETYSTEETDDAENAFDINRVYDTDDPEDQDDGYVAEDSNHPEDEDGGNAKELKKVEKEVDRALRKTFGRPFSWKREVVSWVAMFAIAFALAFVIDNYVIVNATVPTGSMQNTIMAGDRMIGWRLSYLFSEPERGDIIIFEYPDNPEEIYVKRVIGLPGETVTISDGKIYINDSTEPLEEDYLPEEWVWKNDGYTFVVPENSYLCLGDNRNNSHDARSWTNTYVTKDAILGQAILCYWPMEDFSWLD